MAKSLFSAGTTWPGVFTGEDQRALDVLCARPDVDPRRVGCAGLSGGGLRTAYLAGLDDRIRCACCVGMMTTWRDYLLNKCYTHTWMIYIPGLPPRPRLSRDPRPARPRPTLVLNNTEDSLFTIDEMQRADRILAEVFAKADGGGSLPLHLLPRPAQVRPARCRPRPSTGSTGGSRGKSVNRGWVRFVILHFRSQARERGGDSWSRPRWLCFARLTHGADAAKPASTGVGFVSPGQSIACNDRSISRMHA